MPLHIIKVFINVLVKETPKFELPSQFLYDFFSLEPNAQREKVGINNNAGKSLHVAKLFCRPRFIVMLTNC